MRAVFYRYKIVIPILIISIIYNLIWFSGFISVVIEFQEHKVIITLAFLLFYVIIAQPVKDQFVHSIFFKLLYPDTDSKVIKDRRIKGLTKKKDIKRLLKVMVKELDLKGLSMVSREREIIQENFTAEPKAKNLKITKEDFSILSKYFESGIKEILSGQMPPDLKNLCDAYHWNMIIPIYYKSRFFGFLAVHSGSDYKKTMLLESLAGRIGLVLENEILTDAVIQKKFFKKEFHVARKVEKLLQEKNTIEPPGYLISLENEGQDYFSSALLFEKSIPYRDKDGEFYIFCKISKSHRRVRNMMLFITAGYFFIHSRNNSSLKNLHKNIAQSLHENGLKFGIEGFLVQRLNAFKWRVCFFGPHVRLSADGKAVSVKTTSALGLEKTPQFTSFDFSHKKEVSLSINDSHKVKIRKNEK